ncbi:hypothetical protein AGDE_06319 [Angomonas deanei]|nr:hypothetical protein AGDE_06319 [Angomonas deanei]|eukprot:EPY37615.1 hypothetical protein AGDE_06319 [Angomonas deanei]
MSALLFLLLIVPLTDKNSPMFRMQGMPWWELPVGTSSCILLLRILYPRSEENHIKEEFEAECKKNIYLTLDQFINWRYPHLFDGYRYNQAQVIATVAACLSAASDLKFAKTMYKAVGRNKDTKNSVDEVVDAIRREYSSLF